MKKVLIAAFLLAVVLSCKDKDKNDDTLKKPATYLSFGEQITEESPMSREAMASKFEGLKEGDTIDVKFASTINEVCKAKGCWMKLDLGSEKETMVRFTDYGFFVPLDSDNKAVIVAGRAYVTKTSVEQLRHYAKDAGEPQEEIEKITEPKFTYAFEADGVLREK